jgi:hypothetical protein
MDFGQRLVPQRVMGGSATLSVTDGCHGRSGDDVKIIHSHSGSRFKKRIPLCETSIAMRVPIQELFGIGPLHLIGMEQLLLRFGLLNQEFKSVERLFVRSAPGKRPIALNDLVHVFALPTHRPAPCGHVCQLSYVNSVPCSGGVVRALNRNASIARPRWNRSALHGLVRWRIP